MTVRYLLDTSVFSQPIRKKPVWPSLRRWDSEGDELLAASSIAVAEIEYGLFLKNSDQLWESYKKFLRGRLRILDFSSSTASVFGELKATQEKMGKSVDDFDLAIAATAMSHDLILATLNSRHFQLIEGLKWENWSKPLNSDG